MPITDTTEKRFEMDIADFLLSPAGGYTGNHDAYDPKLGLFPETLVRFVQKTQPREWARFVMQNKTEPERKFCLAFNTACDMDGLLQVLRHGFQHRGVSFRVCYFRPESRAPGRELSRLLFPAGVQPEPDGGAAVRGQ